MASVSERFWAKVDKQPNGCWLWRAGRNGGGYGVFADGSHHTVTAHKFARELLAPTEAILPLRNECGSNHCVNPEHWSVARSAQPKPPQLPQSERDYARYLAKIKKVMRVPSLGLGACWEWQAAIDPNGYGRFSVGGRGRVRVQYAHIFSYVYHHGPVPEGKELDHLCRNKCCSNPKHLEAVTHRENCTRSPIHPFFNADVRAKLPSRKQSHCKRGHELSEENRGRRGRCKVCARLYARSHYRNNLELEQQRSRERRRFLREKQEVA